MKMPQPQTCNALTSVLKLIPNTVIYGCWKWLGNAGCIHLGSPTCQELRSLAWKTSGCGKWSLGRVMGATGANSRFGSTDEATERQKGIRKCGKRRQSHGSTSKNPAPHLFHKSPQCEQGHREEWRSAEQMTPSNPTYHCFGFFIFVFDHRIEAQETGFCVWTQLFINFYL